MAWLSDLDRDIIKKRLDEKLVADVKVVFFTKEAECAFCKQASEILNEVASLNPKIKLEAHIIEKEPEKAKEFGIDKAPGIAIIGARDYNVRYFGMPAGYEFTTLVEAIIDVSVGAPNLSEETKKTIAGVNKPVHIMVFVTPTCPYCPSMAKLAYQYAIANPNIRAEVIESNEFQDLALNYAVMGVPKVIINEDIEFNGVLPEQHFTEHVMLAANR